MEFFGAEIRSGQTLAVTAQQERILHLSLVNLGEVTGDAKKDKGNESVRLYLKLGDQKLVLATLSHDKLPQISTDLVFEKDFELSHNWKNGSVYVLGYYASQPSPEYGSESESEDDLALVEDKPKANAENTNKSKPAAKRVQIVEPIKDEEANGDDEDDSSDESDDDGSSDDEAKGLLLKNESAEDSDSDEDDSDDDETSDEDEETPAEAEPSKKRSAAEPSTPVPDKKAKVGTPAKTEDKKAGGHVATPHPAKQAGKTAGNSGQANQTPKPVGSHACTSCGRKFGSDHALQAHSKAKHSAA